MARLGQIIGMVSGGVCLLLTAVILTELPFAPRGVTSGTKWALIGLAVLAVATAVLAWLKRPKWLLLTYVLSFVPVGFYLLLTPGIFKWIGVSHLGYLLAFVLLTIARRTAGLVDG